MFSSCIETLRDFLYLSVLSLRFVVNCFKFTNRLFTLFSLRSDIIMIISNNTFGSSLWLYILHIILFLTKGKAEKKEIKRESNVVSKKTDANYNEIRLCTFANTFFYIIFSVI